MRKKPQGETGVDEHAFSLQLVSVCLRFIPETHLQFQLWFWAEDDKSQKNPSWFKNWNVIMGGALLKNGRHQTTKPNLSFCFFVRFSFEKAQGWFRSSGRIWRCLPSCRGGCMSEASCVSNPCLLRNFQRWQLCMDMLSGWREEGPRQEIRFLQAFQTRSHMGAPCVLTTWGS